MKPALLTIAALIGCWLVYALFFQADDPITNYPSDGETIVAFGDSLVAGVGATENNDVVSQLERMTGETIINIGVPGDTTRDGLARLDVALERDPQVVLLLLGGNDYLRRIPADETFANLAQMIERIHDSGAVVVLLGVRGGLLRDGYAAEYEALAKRYNTAYVADVLDGLLGNPSLMSDQIHPNDEGYWVMAERIAPVLESVTQQ